MDEASGPEFKNVNRTWLLPASVTLTEICASPMAASPALLLVILSNQKSVACAGPPINKPMAIKISAYFIIFSPCHFGTGLKHKIRMAFKPV
jgi:hypothetical protein